MDIVEKEQTDDINNSNKRYTINLKNYNITKIDDLVKLNFSNISTLTLYECNISDIGYILLKEALIHNTSITTIDVNMCRMNNIGAIALSEIIYPSINTHIPTWYYDRYYSKQDFSANKTITSFTITIYGDGNISKIGINALLSSIKNNKYIVYFMLINYNDNTKTDIEGLELLSEIFEHNKTLVVFGIEKIISFTDESDNYDKIIKYKRVLDKFANSLKNNKTLEYLELISNQIDDTDIKIICNALQMNTTLKGINLRSNSIFDKGIKYIADYLKNNKTLEYIDVSINLFTINGLTMLINSLLFNSSLIYIDFIDGHDDCSILYNELKEWCSEDIQVYINDNGERIFDDFTLKIINIMQLIDNNIKSIYNNILKGYIKNEYSDWCNDCIKTDNSKAKLLLEFEKIINKNISLYDTVYWNPWNHLSFKNIDYAHEYITFECHQLVMTTLVCNSYLQHKLSIYLWQYIFSFYQKKQFLFR
jgi:hypothetical protein